MGLIASGHDDNTYQSQTKPLQLRANWIAHGISLVNSHLCAEHSRKAEACKWSCLTYLFRRTLTGTNCALGAGNDVCIKGVPNMLKKIRQRPVFHGTLASIMLLVPAFLLYCGRNSD